MNEKLIKLQALYSLIDYEPYVILIALVIFSWIFYKLFLKEVSAERHKGLRSQFKNLYHHTLWFSVSFVIFKFIYQAEHLDLTFTRVLPYLALFSLSWGIFVFVKACRLIILQYLFLGSMKAGVPILLVNIFSLMLTMTLILWGMSSIFGIQLAPLLATSAAFSIILGLALQDTLGNLFAGISLQLDRAFEIGDWLEITSGAQKIVGQVKEITWRATILAGWSDEVITIPNRTMANSQLSNFQAGDQPIARSQVFRLSLNTDVELAKECLGQTVREISAIRQDLLLKPYISETTDSWILIKIAYYIDSYGSQFTIGDQVLTLGLKRLKEKGIETGHQTLVVQKI
jgi:small-conductance mechanosensitive channel